MIPGKKVYLSSLNRSSLAQLREWRNSPELRKYFREHREISDAMQENWYNNRVLNNSNQVDFEIHDLQSGSLIGHCSLNYIVWTNRTAELGIYIGDKEFRRGGYGTDALNLLMDYAFKTLNLNRVWCEVFSNNEAINVYRKIGFVDEGKMRQHHFEEGVYLDSYILGLLAEDWLKKEGPKE